MSATPRLDDDLPENHELDRVVSLQQAARLMGVSPDTIRRRHSEKILRLSPRRQGMRLRDALLLDGPDAA
jgi:hypothetical protein